MEKDYYIIANGEYSEGIECIIVNGRIQIEVEIYNKIPCGIITMKS